MEVSPAHSCDEDCASGGRRGSLRANSSSRRRPPVPTQSTFMSPVDETVIATYRWGEALADPRGVVQIAHGIAEHGARYARLAEALVARGYRVVANDHRGHGRTAATAADLG